jgi:poly(A) polymerase/tRNA nucleotidyltransferase (CCA-adding enzyme)
MAPEPAERLAVRALLADADLARVWDAVPQARVVGGAVRDALLGRPVADIDLATPLAPDAVAAALGRAGLRALPTGLAHGTVTALSGGRGFEITTLRRDIATDGRHAEVAFTDNWQADAARRDFTFNALSLDRAGAVFDPFGGLADLRAGRVRFVGDPARRVAEDFLRVLRFFRFYARFGAQPPDAATRAALQDGAGGLGRLSAERVWGELKRILATPDPHAALRLMRALGVLAAVLPEADGGRLERLAGLGLPPDPLLRLSAVQGGDPAALAERLRLSGAEAARLAALRGPPPPADPAGLRRALADTPADILADRARLAGSPEQVPTILAAEVPVFPLQGRDLVAAGIKPGPAVGEALRAGRAWWLQHGCAGSAGEVLAAMRLAGGDEAVLEAQGEARRPTPGGTEP